MSPAPGWREKKEKGGLYGRERGVKNFTSVLSIVSSGDLIKWKQGVEKGGKKGRGGGKGRCSEDRLKWQSA